MNRAAYRHLINTYGHSPAQWVGLFLEVIRTLLGRVAITIIMAQIAGNIAEGDTDAARRNALVFFAVWAVGASIGAVGELLSLKSENEQYRKLLVRYHQKLVNKDMSFYRDNQTGYLASAFRQHLDSGMALLRLIRTNLLRTSISLVVPMIVLFFADWKVGLVALCIIIVQLIYIFWSSAKANKYRVLSHEIFRRITGEVSDEITNIVAFKSGGVEKESHSKIALLSLDEVHAFWMRRKTTTILDLPRDILTAIGVTVSIYFIIDGASNSSQSVGLIVLTLTYMFQIIRTVAELPGLIVQHDDLVTNLYPTLNYLSNDYETIKNPADPKPLHIKKAVIDMNDIDFSYPAHSGEGKRISVFKGLNLHIAGGEQVGIVGLSGAGKSTLASLLMRFDDIEGGSITIDGTDIREVDQSELRKQIAYVPQEPLLFHRSIRENIAYFNDLTSDKDVIRAAKAAHAHEFIEKLPEKYETIVGERGIKLSGGQKQRVVIARAILKNAPIILFDEATSALDSQSEQIIQQAMPEIIGKQTAIVIAHRLSTVANLDRIVVMHNGKIIEQGTHAELLKMRGRYFSLWRKQTEGK